MFKRTFAYLQYILPQRSLTALAGWLAESRVTWFKNLLIQRFINTYQVDMTVAKIEDAKAYPTFNDFFIRELKPQLRPLACGDREIACPADGRIAEMGHIDGNRLFQAKQFYYDLPSLLGGDTQLCQHFHDGHFATIYLAPYNYHRFHMPVTGQLLQSIYVPGKLFSVNRTTAEYIPNLYARNERVIAHFDTEAGPMAVVMVGAMIVGNIQLAWMDKPSRSPHLTTTTYPHQPTLNKGDEMGYFKLGSTIILLFGKNKIVWADDVKPNSVVEFGQNLGYFSK